MIGFGRGVDSERVEFWFGVVVVVMCLLYIAVLVFLFTDGVSSKCSGLRDTRLCLFVVGA